MMDKHEEAVVCWGLGGIYIYMLSVGVLYVEFIHICCFVCLLF